MTVKSCGRVIFVSSSLCCCYSWSRCGSGHGVCLFKSSRKSIFFHWWHMCSALLFQVSTSATFLLASQCQQHKVTRTFLISWNEFIYTNIHTCIAFGTWQELILSTFAANCPRGLTIDDTFTRIFFFFFFWRSVVASILFTCNPELFTHWRVSARLRLNPFSSSASESVSQDILVNTKGTQMMSSITEAWKRRKWQDRINLSLHQCMLFPFDGGGLVRRCA